jgi:hypothetical protein
MVNLPACVFDILTVNGLTNLIVNPTHFFSNSETLIDSILVTDSIRVIDSDTTYTYRQKESKNFDCTGVLIYK